MAMLCVGLFAGAMALQSLQSTGDPTAQSGSVIWNAFQFWMPLLVGALCLTGKRWAFMTAVIYGTIGLALDISTAVQSVTNEFDSAAFIVVIFTTALLNFLLITFGGKGVLSEMKIKDIS